MTAKVWKQCNGPPMDEWISYMWYTYKMEYYSAMRKEGILPFVTTQMDVEHIIQNEMSDRERQVLNDTISIYMWDL